MGIIEKRDEVLQAFIDAGHKKGKKPYSALAYLFNYKTLTVKKLQKYPFYSNGETKIIQIINDFFKEYTGLGVVLDYEWKQNEKTKSRYKEFFLSEVA